MNARKAKERRRQQRPQSHGPVARCSLCRKPIPFTQPATLVPTPEGELIFDVECLEKFKIVAAQHGFKLGPSHCDLGICDHDDGDA